MRISQSNQISMVLNPSTKHTQDEGLTCTRYVVSGSNSGMMYCNSSCKSTEKM